MRQSCPQNRCQRVWELLKKCLKLRILIQNYWCLQHNLGGAKNSSKILIYTNMCDFRLLDKRNICLFQYNHELRSWEVVVDGTNSPIRLKRNLKSDLLMNLGEQFVQVNQKIIINVDFLSEVVDNICHFYPPFDHLDYVRISRIYRRKFIERFLAL